MKAKKIPMTGIILIILVMGVGIGQLGATTVIGLPDPYTSAVLYGNAFSYSLPTLAYFYDQQFGGGVGPGTPFYVDSSPGKIMNDIVIATGASGGPLNTNFAGMNDAYATPSGSVNNPDKPYFTTGENHPGQTPTLLLNNPTTWNTNIGALKSYLTDGSTPVFFFNNNQTNSGDAIDQQLAIWGQAILVKSGNPSDNPIYFTLANNLPPGNTGISGSVFPVFSPDPGGILFGPDKNPYLYSRGAPDSTYPLNTPGTVPALPYDFVLSGGEDCIDAAGVLVACGTTEVVRINHNLGANQAAYAVVIPGLNDFLSTWTPANPYDVLQLDIRMGCNPAFFDCPEGWELNNGYEQIFIGQGFFGPPVPEPGTLILLGSGLVGIGLWIGKHRRKS